MKFAGISITRQRKIKRTIEQQVGDFLNNDPRVMQCVARMARSEVKSYLGELAEGVEMPFSDPASFLAWVRAAVATAGAAELKYRIFGSPEEREQAERNLKLVDQAFDDPHSVLRSLKLHPLPDFDDTETWDEFNDDPGVQRGED